MVIFFAATGSVFVVFAFLYSGTIELEDASQITVFLCQAAADSGRMMSIRSFCGS